MIKHQQHYGKGLAQQIEHAELVITTLSPIHIGNGEDLSPTQYVIDDCKLYILNEVSMISALGEQERKELNQMCDQFTQISTRDKKMLNTNLSRQISSIQNFMYKHRTVIKKSAIKVIPISKELERFYHNKIANKDANEQAKLEIPMTFHHPLSFEPIIPGSTLKGAFRQGITNALLSKELHKAKHNSKPLEIEKTVLKFKDATDDPLSALKLSDTFIQDHAPTQVLFARHYLKADPQDKKLWVLKHVISPFTIRKLNLSYSFNHKKAQTTPLNKVSLTSLFKEINAFYLPQFKAEVNRLDNHKLSQDAYFNLNINWCRLIKQFLNAIEPQLLAGHVAILRLGQYGGAESKTWDNLRKIKISKPGTEPKFGVTATTQWLGGFEQNAINFSLPFGWILIENKAHSLSSDVLNPLMLGAEPIIKADARAREEIDALQQKWRDEANTRKQAREDAIANQIAKAAQKQADEEKQALIEAQRASMTPAQLSIEKVRDQLMHDKTYTIKNPTGELRGYLRESCETVSADGGSELKESLKLLFDECCKWWGVDRKSNAKLKDLWKLINN